MKSLSRGNSSGLMRVIILIALSTSENETSCDESIWAEGDNPSSTLRPVQSSVMHSDLVQRCDSGHFKVSTHKSTWSCAVHALPQAVHGRVRRAQDAAHVYWRCGRMSRHGRGRVSLSTLPALKHPALPDRRTSISSIHRLSFRVEHDLSVGRLV